MKADIAIISALGLGDGLLSMILAHNLKQNGYSVKVFSDYLTQLHEWFPQHTIVNYPTGIKAGEMRVEKLGELFQPFDLIVSTDGAPLFAYREMLGDKYKIFYEHDFDRRQTIAANFMAICRDFFHLADFSIANGLVMPATLQPRKFIQRVIIHPTSTCHTKNWLPEKFVRLARKLQQQGFEPVFVVSPTERQEWLWVESHGFALPYFANLDRLARFVAESGYMIGNDSGIGHLASNLGIPTLSLFARRSMANLWRPNWSAGRVVTPVFQLPGARLRVRYWKKFLTVRRVRVAFDKLLLNVTHERTNG
ncbi:MAG: glycosyltransferase family 9 protein [Gammaproteobacteria bacterium]